MATRQYIGARYVTKVYINSQDPQSAEWESNTTYEPLTMVTYNNSSYLSRSDVPASVGNPVDNPTYWAQTGFYNGQIAQLQQDIADVQDNLDAYVVNKLKNRRIVVVTDSYGGAPTASTSFLPLTAAQLGMTEGDNFFGIYAGSHGFVANGVNTFLSLLTSNAANITDHDTITDIIVLGGNNDRAASMADITTAIENFATYCASEFPNALVSVGMFSYDKDTAFLLVRQEIDHVYRSIIASGGAFINDASTWLHWQAFTSDGIHPTNAGASCIANGLCNYILGSEDRLDIPWQVVTMSPSGDFASGSMVGGAQIFEMFDGVSIYANIADEYFSFGTHISVTLDNQWHEIATCNSPILVGCSQSRACATGILGIYDYTLNTYTFRPANFAITGGKLYYRAHECTATGTTNMTYSDVAGVALNSINIIASGINN